MKTIKLKLFHGLDSQVIKSITLPLKFLESEGKPELGQVIEIDEEGIGTVELNEAGEEYFEELKSNSNFLGYKPLFSPQN